MRGQQLSAGRQADAAAGGSAGGETRREDGLGVGGRQARPAVGNRHQATIATAQDLDRDPAALRQGGERVEQQVDQDLPQHGSRHGSRRRLEPALERPGGSAGGRRGRRGRPGAARRQDQQRGRLHRRHGVGGVAGVRRRRSAWGQPPQHRRGVRRRQHDRLEVRPVSGFAAQQQFRAPGDHRQHLVDVVDDTGRREVAFAGSGGRQARLVGAGWHAGPFGRGLRA